MNKLWSVLLVAALSITALDADARRMGGGRSVGQQSGNVMQRQATPPVQPAAPAQNAAAPRQGAAQGAAAAQAQRKPWGAMLGGLAAGLGLAWLASSLGLGEAFGNILTMLLIGMLVLAVVGFFLRRRAAAAMPAGAGAGGPNMAYREPAPAYKPQNVGNDASARPWENQAPAAANFQSAGAAAGGSMIGAALGGNQNWGVPDGFDTEGFLKASKANFVSLQAAWDRGDVSSLRAMMTDDMLREIQSQLAEREAQGGQPTKTEVLTLDASLLGIEERGGDYMASVEFTGVLREDDSAGPSPFREVWNITKAKSGGGWLVAGLQAMQ
ncbi:putative lipid-binding transport protein (Tim44 family) [Comamonas sp. BIGb0124]|uniref:Tim44 domain-containing protein n=1 Tax=Comamonas sp. BIGb0124 TaxID=2485130 RepID=UPI000F486381|nr:Tim44-like domain-containing protein [Comamonas sp. BIGb0124]ROR20326.1 putative lipid-binding transport protein (Tim44 family) [Comamonas sp. BIGb0124]